jgi:hypothetical protein
VLLGRVLLGRVLLGRVLLERVLLGRVLLGRVLLRGCVRWRHVRFVGWVRGLQLLEWLRCGRNGGLGGM